MTQILEVDSDQAVPRPVPSSDTPWLEFRFQEHGSNHGAYNQRHCQVPQVRVTAPAHATAVHPDRVGGGFAADGSQPRQHPGERRLELRDVLENTPHLLRPLLRRYLRRPGKRQALATGSGNNSGVNLRVLKGKGEGSPLCDPFPVLSGRWFGARKCRQAVPVFTGG